MTTRLKCVIVDDDPVALDFTTDYLTNSSIAEVTGHYKCPEEFLDEAPKINFDLAVLDISMPKMSGFELAKLIPGKSVIFMTGYDNNFKRVIQFPAIDIISKPFSKERLLFGIEKARRFIKGKLEDYSFDYDLFSVEGLKGQISIKTGDILFASVNEKERRHKNILLKDGKKYTLMYCTFERLLNYPTDLVRINKSELISRSIIHTVEDDLITLRTFTETGKPWQVTLSKTYRNSFKSAKHKK